MKTYLFTLILTTLLFTKGNGKEAQKADDIINTVFKNNRIQIDSIQNCNTYINILEFFSRNDTSGLFDTIAPYYYCSSKNLQDVSSESCCNKLPNSVFSLVQWPNLNNTQNIESLYVPNMWQGICHPDICTAEDLQQNKKTIDTIINNLQLNYWLTEGKEKIKIPEGNGSNSSSVMDLFTGDGESSLFYRIHTTEIKRKSNGFLHIMTITAFILPLLFFLLILTQSLLPESYQLPNSITSAFDYRKQLKSVLSKGRANELNVFNLFRVIGVVLIFLIHTFQNQHMAKNYHSVASESHRPFIALVYFAFEAVDLFLFMGGFFQAISWAAPKKLDIFIQGSAGGLGTVLRAQWQRFLRIWPVLLIIMLIFTQFFYSFGSGPMWNQLEHELENCDKYMYSNLLLIDNLGEEFTWKCFGHSWYLSVDFQLYFFCLFCLLVFAYNRKVGKAMMWLTIIGCGIYNFYFAFHNHVRALDVSDVAKFEESRNYYIVGMYFYRKPWARAPIFLAGLLFGISYVHKTGIFSKTFKQTTTFYTNMILLGVIIVLGVIAFPIPLLSNPEAYSIKIQSLYFAIMPLLTTVAWILMISGLMHYYNLKDREWVNKLVNSQFIGVMAKISFIVYLSHILYLKYDLYNGSEIREWSVESLLLRLPVSFTVACFWAFVLHLYFEAPLQTIINNYVKVGSSANAGKQQEMVAFSKVTQKSDEERQDEKISEKFEPESFSDEGYATQGSIFARIIKYGFILILGMVTYYWIFKKRETFEDFKFQRMECFFSCSSCTGPAKNQCTECYDSFELLPNGVCELKEKTNKDNWLLNIKTFINEAEEQEDAEDALSTFQKMQMEGDGESKQKTKKQTQELSEKVQQSICADKSVPFVYFKKGNYLSRWIIHFQKLNHVEPIADGELFAQNFQDQIEDFDANLKKNGIFDFDSERNPVFYNYSYATFVDCSNGDLKQYQKNVEGSLDFLVTKRQMNYAREIFIVGLNEYEISESISWGDKMQQILKKEYNVQAEVRFIFDGIPTNSEKYVEKIKNMKHPAYFVIPSENWITISQKCSNLNRTYTPTQEEIKRAENKQDDAYVKAVIEKANNDPLSDIWKPSCSFRTYTDLKRQYTTKITNSKDSPIHFWLALKIWKNTVNGYKNFFEFEHVNKKELNCEELNLNEQNVVCWGPKIDFSDSGSQTKITPDFLTQKEEFNSDPWSESKNYQLDGEDFGQKCLNGGQPFIQYKKGKYKQRFIFNFQGGGMSKATSQGTYEEAVEFTASGRQGDPVKGQQASLFPNMDRAGLKEYTMINVYYCDGHLEQGYMNDPLILGGKKYWLRGQNNTLAAINYAFKNFDFANSKQTLLMGGSSGGVTVSIWMDFIRDRIKEINPYTDVRGIISAGLFMDYPNINGERIYKEGIVEKGFYNHVNKNSPPPNKKCVDDQKPEDVWKCLFTDFNIKYIDTPFLVLESGYDYIATNQILNIYCYGQDSDTPWKRTKGENEKFSMKKCNSKEMSYIEGYREQLIKNLDGVYQENENMSIFMPSCAFHNILTMKMSEKTQVPYNSGNSIYKMVHHFIDGKGRFNLIDRVKYPLNKGCADHEP